MGWGSGVLLIGGLSLLQYILGVDLGIDQLLMHDYITEQLLAPHSPSLTSISGPIHQLFISIEQPLPGRLSPNTAFSFTLVGITLIALSTVNARSKAVAKASRPVEWAEAIAATCAIGAIAIGTVALLGYIIQLSDVYTWRYLIGVALPTAAELPLLGLGLMLIALRPHQREFHPRWLPVSMAFGMAMISLLVWQVMLSWYSHLTDPLSPNLTAQLKPLLMPAAHMLLIRNILTDPIDHAIVDAISRTGQVMKLETVAECVENDAVLAHLQTLGIDYAQGYGVARPMPLIPSQARGWQRNVVVNAGGLKCPVGT